MRRTRGGDVSISAASVEGMPPALRRGRRSVRGGDLTTTGTKKFSRSASIGGDSGSNAGLMDMQAFSRLQDALDTGSGSLSRSLFMP